VAKQLLNSGANSPEREFTESSPKRLTELTLLVVAWIVIGGAYILASFGEKGHMPPKLYAFLAVVIITSGLLHLGIRKFAPMASQILMPIATLLNGIGYVEIARWNPVAASYQAFYSVVSAIAVIGVLFLVKNVRDLDRYRYLTLVAALGLMLMPLIPHFGQNVNGARMWVRVGPVSFQPVELAKILLVFFFASYFSTNREVLSTPTQSFGPFRIVAPRVLLPIVIAWVLTLAILGAENDIGFAMMIFALFISMLWVTTGLRTYLGLGMVLFVAGGFAVIHLFHHVQSRISMWLDPWSAHNFNLSSQLANGWFSLSAGGILGTGLGLGQAGRWVSFATSDMITASLGEELGLVGLVIVICLFAVFVGEGFRIAQRAQSDFIKLTAGGLTILMGLQVFFIMAGVFRLVPLTGITLPFMAYGGSALICNYLLVAVLLRISHANATERVGGGVIQVDL
jgi:cell division protein FtsW (lipid II flippase)